MIVNEKDEKGWEDPIVAEIHSVREELARRLDNDPKKIFEYNLQKQKEGKLTKTLLIRGTRAEAMHRLVEERHRFSRVVLFLHL